MSIISVTERQLFKRCRRKWELSSFSRQSLVPIINAPALELGTIIHATLAKWTEDPQLDPNEIYDTYASQSKEHIILSYQSRIGCLPSLDELAPTLAAIGLGRSMIANYQTYWHTPLPPGYTLIQNEQTLTQPIAGTEHCVSGCSTCPFCMDHPNNLALCFCDKELHSLEATFDGVMADELGQLFIIERKTFARHPSEDELDENDQFLAYMWAFNQGGLGKVRGVSYDGLWKRDHPPANKKLSDLFLRKILQRNEQELEEFGQLLALEAMEMCDPNVHIYKNVPALGGCWDCGFRALCKSMSRSPDYHTQAILNTYVKSDHKRWRNQEVE